MCLEKSTKAEDTWPAPRNSMPSVSIVQPEVFRSRPVSLSARHRTKAPGQDHCDRPGQRTMRKHNREDEAMIIKKKLGSGERRPSSSSARKGGNHDGRESGLR